MLGLGSIGMDQVTSELCYKGTILQKNYNPFLKFHGKNIRSHNITVIYPKLCYNEVCYNWTILQKIYRKMTIAWSFSYTPIAKFHGKYIRSHNMTVLFPNL